MAHDSNEMRKPGRPREVDIETVRKAGREIESEGKSVTPAKLHRKVGRGAPQTLMNMWLECKTQDADQGPPIMMPPELEDVVSDLQRRLVEHLWSFAYTAHHACEDAAGRRLTAEVEALQRERREMQDQIGEVSTLVDETQDKADRAEQARKDVEAECARERQARQKLEADQAQANARIAAQDREQEDLKQELAAERERRDDLTRRLAAAETQRYGFEQRLADAERKIEVLQHDLDQARERATRAETEKHHLEQQREAYRKKMHATPDRTGAASSESKGGAALTAPAGQQTNKENNKQTKKLNKPANGPNAARPA